jgi:hypothetical protein
MHVYVLAKVLNASDQLRRGAYLHSHLDSARRIG